LCICKFSEQGRYAVREGLPHWGLPLYSEGPVSVYIRLNPVGFPGAIFRPPGGDRSTVLHPFSHERPTLIGKGQLKNIEINQWQASQRLCSKCTCASKPLCWKKALIVMYVAFLQNS